MDDRLSPYLNFKKGFFVEAGANNGIAQSNTYYLEAILGWKGMLIEPVPDLFELCKRARPKSKAVNAALVSKDFPHKSVELECAGLMTSVSAGAGNKNFDPSHVERGRAILQMDQSATKVTAPARTLNSLFIEYGVKKIDFMSLDLEGYELEALKGLDLSQYAPRWLLVEVREQAVIDYLSPYYEIQARLTENEAYSDGLFKRKEI